MLTFEEARLRVTDAAEALESEEVELEQAQNRVLAASVRASGDLPAFDYAAMDGYALDSRNLPDAGPYVLEIVGESRAGHAFRELEAGQSCRIFTGAPMPGNANAVLLQEDALSEGSRLSFRERPRLGEHVRRAGEDLKQGALALERGTRLGPYQLGLLAAMDCALVRVQRQPRVAILSTGDELRRVGDPSQSFTIPNSNAHVISAMVRQVGAIATQAGQLPDDVEPTHRVLAQLLPETDVLVTIGGVSVGDYDVVKQALAMSGVSLEFWKVRIRPGKPLVFGRFQTGFVLGLPGNPVSAQLDFALFGLPLLRKLLGLEQLFPRVERARLETAVEQSPGRLGFCRGKIVEQASELLVKPLRGQSSGSVTGLAWADVLILIPAESAGFAAGSPVDILRLAEL